MADKGELPHNVVFIFQPAEETGGGANRLIKAGAFDKYPIEAVFGIHVNPLLKKEKLLFVMKKLQQAPQNIASI